MWDTATETPIRSCPDAGIACPARWRSTGSDWSVTALGSIETGPKLELTNMKCQASLSTRQHAFKCILVLPVPSLVLYRVLVQGRSPLLPHDYRRVIASNQTPSFQGGGYLQVWTPDSLAINPKYSPGGFLNPDGEWIVDKSKAGVFNAHRVGGRVGLESRAGPCIFQSRRAPFYTFHCSRKAGRGLRLEVNGDSIREPFRAGATPTEEGPPIPLAGPRSTDISRVSVYVKWLPRNRLEDLQ